MEAAGGRYCFRVSQKFILWLTLRKNGCRVMVLRRRRFTPGRAARVLDQMLADPRVIHACTLARTRIARGGDAVAEACDEIEAVAAG